MSADVVTLFPPPLRAGISPLGAELRRLIAADGRALQWDGDANGLLLADAQPIRIVGDMRAKPGMIGIAPGEARRFAMHVTLDDRP